MEGWHIWVCLGIVLFILEIVFFSFIWASLAIGCLFAAFAAYFNFGINYQLILFSAGVLFSFFFIRPLVIGKYCKSYKPYKTNVESLIGKEARVVASINSKKNEGRVIVDGVDWKAESFDDEVIYEGEKVEILKVNSTILIVKPKHI